MENIRSMNNKGNNSGWLVTSAGTGALLALGVLYAWSVFKANIPIDWGWTDAQKTLPYSVACIFFSVMTLVGARMLSKLSPRLIISLGGLLAGSGVIISSMSTSPWVYTFAFGFLLGSGIGFVYSSASPSALKWFPASKTGLISGIVVGGFGMGSAWVAPLARKLIAVYGLQSTMLYLGIGMLLVVIIFAQFVKFPPAGYEAESNQSAKKAAKTSADYNTREVLKTWQFYTIWVIFALGAGAGLMVIGNLASIINEQIGLPALSAIAVSALAIGNGGGRVLYGLLSDKLGRKNVLVFSFVFQAVLVFLLSTINKESILANPVLIIIMVILIGANYGANLSVFPAITKDFFGLKHFALNYGFVYLAWGLGGFMLSQLAGSIKDATGSYTLAYLLSAGSLIIAVILTVILKKPQMTSKNVPDSQINPAEVLVEKM